MDELHAAHVSRVIVAHDVFCDELVEFRNAIAHRPLPPNSNRLLYALGDAASLCKDILAVIDAEVRELWRDPPPDELLPPGTEVKTT